MTTLPQTRRELLRSGTIVTSTTLFGVTTFSTAAIAHPPEEGCTPGYWRNPAYRNSVWEDAGIDPDDTVGRIFDETYIEGDLGDLTLREALGGGGGPGLEGAQRILFRAAVAAILNVNHPDINYGDGKWGKYGIIDQVNDALSNQNRNTILELAETLDAFNNLGCPVNAFGDPK